MLRGRLLNSYNVIPLPYVGSTLSRKLADVKLDYISQITTMTINDP